MGRSVSLLACSWPDTEHMSLLNAVLLIGKRRIQRPHRECMRARGLVQVGLDRGIECPQCLVIQIIQKIPEQA